MTAITTPLRRAVAPVWDHRVFGPALKVLLGYVIVVQVLLQYLFGKIPLAHVGRGEHIIPTEIIILGLVYGALYGPWIDVTDQDNSVVSLAARAVAVATATSSSR